MSHRRLSSLLVTGGSGFVGSEIVRQARADGILVRSPMREELDVRDPNSIPVHLAGIDAVVHAAGLAHRFSHRNATADSFAAYNTDGTSNVARAAAAAGIKHLVLVSSVAVYGSQSDGVIIDEQRECVPSGRYAESKYHGERRAIEATADTETALTILRMATVYGEGDPGNVARLIRSIDRRRFIWIGNGENRKSLIHISDAARACLTAASRRPDTTVTYNVSAPPVAMREVVNTIGDLLGRQPPRVRVSARSAHRVSALIKALGGARGRLDTPRRLIDKWLSDEVFSAERFYEHFTFEPEIPLSEGLRREIEWYRSRHMSGR